MTVSEKNRVARPEKQVTFLIPAIDPKAVEAQTKDKYPFWGKYLNLHTGSGAPNILLSGHPFSGAIKKAFNVAQQRQFATIIGYLLHLGIISRMISSGSNSAFIWFVSLWKRESPLHLPP